MPLMPGALDGMMQGSGAGGPDLASLLQQPQDPAGGGDPLSSLQDAIHAVAAAMSALPDPQDTQDAAQALLVLSRIQTRVMGQQAPGASQTG